MRLSNLLEFKGERKEMFELLAPWYDKIRKFIGSGEVKEITREIKKLEKNKQKPLKVLDVGGGTGKYWEVDSLGGVDLYLLDRSKSMLNESRSETIPIQGDVHSLPFEDGFFDVVVCIDALHHFEDRITSLKEMERISKIGTCIFVADFDPDHLLTNIISAGEIVLGEPGKFIKTEKLDDFFEKRGHETEKIDLASYFYLFKSEKLVD